MKGRFSEEPVIEHIVDGNVTNSVPLQYNKYQIQIPSLLRDDGCSINLCEHIWKICASHILLYSNIIRQFISVYVMLLPSKPFNFDDAVHQHEQIQSVHICCHTIFVNGYRSFDQSGNPIHVFLLFWDLFFEDHGQFPILFSSKCQSCQNPHYFWLVQNSQC